MSSSQTLTTLCFRTVDALARDEERARLAFESHGFEPRLKPHKVMLGSLEFPMVQYSVEAAWNRLHFCEDLRVLAGARAFRLELRGERNAPPLELALPLHLNRVRVRRRAGRLLVLCDEPHGLWPAGPGGRCVLAGGGWPAVQATGAWLLQSAGGGVQLLAPDDVEYVSARAFAVPRGAALGLVAAHGAGHLHVPGPHSPGALVSTLDTLLRAAAPPWLRLRLDFDAAACACRLEVATDAADVRAVGVGGDALPRLLGFGAGASVPLTPPGGDSCRVPSGMVDAFDYAELPEGWYVPAHRPMGTGPPLRLPAELELSLNRFAFVPASKEEPPPCLVFRDPSGRTHAAQLAHGIYGPHELAAALEHAMRRAVGAGCAMEARYDEEVERFELRCYGHARRPAPFDLLLSHPVATDLGRRLGFGRADLLGLACHTSESRVHVPALEWPPRRGARDRRRPINLYQVGEEGPLKRLTLGTRARPVLIAHVRGGARNRLRLATYLHGLPFAHGLAPGELVRLAPMLRPAQVLGEAEQPLELTPLCVLERRTRHAEAGALPLFGVVLPAAPPARSCAPPAPPPPHHLTLWVPDLGWTASEGNACVLDVRAVPFSLALGPTLPRTLGGARLGFPARVIQWGVDGRARAHGAYRPGPYLAPHVHDFDHPDYVLVYLEEGKGSTALQHRSGVHVTTPFAKIVLYPLFREERLVPREVQLSSGESLSRFTLRFENPDGTPYHFHGAEFSFTLNLIA